MNREEAKEYVKEHLEDYLRSKGIDASNGKKFRCLNPAHNDKKPSMSIDRSSKSGLHCKCFSCQAYYDTFDLIAIDYGLSEEKDIFSKGYEIYGFQIDGAGEYQKQAKNKRNTQYTLHNEGYTMSIEEVQEDKREDFTAIAKEAHRKLLASDKAMEYLKNRGLSEEIIKRYELGYDSEGYNHFLKDFPEHQSKSRKESLYRLFFPYPDEQGNYTYILSEIADRKHVDDYNGKYRKMTNYTAQLFNERYLKADAPEVIFICEGVYDALSVEEAGGSAIAFVGTAHKRFLGLCKKYKPATTFIISLDNDGAGADAIERVKNGLDELGIPYLVRTAPTGKDFNEALQTDRTGFTEFIEQVVEETREEARQREQAEREALQKEAVAYSLQDFISEIEKSKTAACYSTGWGSLDNLLDGGLYSGLYIFGAISSLGKTTFCLQLCDNIAASGQDVLIFSLEMARTELIAKSVSRLTLIKDLEDNGTTSHAKTTRGILTGSRYKYYNQTEKTLIQAAVAAYGQYGKNIYITEGVGNVGIKEIRAKIEKHIAITGKKPVVLIDYLQIIAPADARATDKQNTDKAVLELKRISRDYSIPIIGISSFNRNSYTDPVNMAAFKESGAIEYSSDTLIGLQLEGMDYQEGEADGARQKRIRKLVKEAESRAKNGKSQSIQVKVLKNRNGSKGDTLLDFYPAFNYFTEKPKGAENNEYEDEDGDGYKRAESSGKW